MKKKLLLTLALALLICLAVSSALAVSFSKTSKTVYTKGSADLNAYITDLAKKEKVVAWYSSDESIVTVSGGTVRAGKNTGTAIITAETNKHHYASIKIKVKQREIPTTGLKVNVTEVTLGTGSRFSIIATVKPSNSTQKVTYKSSNEKVAYVSSEGVITAKREGTAKITVKSGEKSKKIIVTVKKTPAFTVSPESVTLHPGESTSVLVTRNFSGAGQIYCHVNDSDVISARFAKSWNGNTIDLYIDAYQQGTATITLTNSVNDDAATVEVTVRPNLDINIQDIPLTMNVYSKKGTLKQTYTVNDIRYTVDSANDVTLMFDGEKTYDYRGKTKLSAPEIQWKLYKTGTGIVVNSGTCYIPLLSTGDKFEGADYLYDLPKGEYSLILMTEY